MANEIVQLIRQKTCYEIPGVVKTENGRDYEVGDLINIWRERRRPRLFGQPKR